MKQGVKRGAAKSSDAKLLAAARRAASNAYAPYSSFAVGAAVETSDGRIFTGANMENASYGLTLCAEAGALQAASGAGALSLVRKIAIVGGPIAVTGKKPSPVTPCGRCRQLIQEASMASGNDVAIVMSDLGLRTQATSKISKLLPNSFSASELPGLRNWAHLSRFLKRRLG